MYFNIIILTSSYYNKYTKSASTTRRLLPGTTGGLINLESQLNNNREIEILLQINTTCNKYNNQLFSTMLQCR